MILDTHQHFWRVDRGDYHWMTPSLSILYQDYLPDMLWPNLRKAGVWRTVLVQAAQTVAETDFLLSLAASTDFVAGVVGWLDMEREDFPDQLSKYCANPYFLGVRPMLHDTQDDAWILQPRVLANLAHLAEKQFPFEFLTYPRHLPHVVEALHRTPRLHALVDHLSKPPIAAKELEPWKSLMTEVASFQNIYCKLSGMITEADPISWSPDDLRPYIEHVYDSFGADRVMFGSDWPVCLLAGSYAEVCNALRVVLDDQLDSEQMEKLFFRNGMRFYSLESTLP
ncbi:MAG: amidohydrolase family protein [Pirellulales bacterium]